MESSKKSANLHIAGGSIESKIAFMKSSKTWNSNQPISSLRENLKAVQSIIDGDSKDKDANNPKDFQNLLYKYTESGGNENYHRTLLNLDVEMDTEADMPFLLCPLNRYSPDKHLFRSPWTSNYYPKASSTDKNADDSNDKDELKELFNEPYQELAGFETRANEMFNFYAELYHNGEKGLATSVYVTDYEPNEFIEVIFLLKKKQEESTWSTAHHFKIILQSDKTKFICFSGVYSQFISNGVELSFKNDLRDEFTTKEIQKDTVHKHYIA